MISSMNKKFPSPLGQAAPYHYGASIMFHQTSNFLNSTFYFPSDPNKLNLLSSEKITAFQKFMSLFIYSLANFQRSNLFFLLMCGFSRATLPWKLFFILRRNWTCISLLVFNNHCCQICRRCKLIFLYFTRKQFSFSWC